MSTIKQKPQAKDASAVTIIGKGRFAVATIVGGAPLKNIDDIILVGEIFQKVKLDEEVRSRLIKKLPTGGEMFDEEELARLEDLQIALEPAERRKLKAVINGHIQEHGLTAGAAAWLAPLFKQLEA